MVGCQVVVSIAGLVSSLVGLVGVSIVELVGSLVGLVVVSLVGQ